MSKTTLKSNRREQTRKHIVDSFLSLIPDKDWDKISVKELCAAADITRGTFYQYFTDIYDLMEQLETYLLDDISSRYEELLRLTDCPTGFSLKNFDQSFDYSPPKMLLVWFDFCKEYPKEMVALLDRKHGDSYFVKRLKKILITPLNVMMDSESFPRDDMREHFITIFMELHLLAAQTWLDKGDSELLSVDEIINLLNTVRVGANYISYRQSKDKQSG